MTNKYLNGVRCSHLIYTLHYIWIFISYLNWIQLHAGLLKKYINILFKTCIEQILLLTKSNNTV